MAIRWGELYGEMSDEDLEEMEYQELKLEWEDAHEQWRVFYNALTDIGWIVPPGEEYGLPNVMYSRFGTALDIAAMQFGYDDLDEFCRHAISLYESFKRMEGRFKKAKTERAIRQREAREAKKRGKAAPRELTP